MLKVKRLIKDAFEEVARNGWTPESIARLVATYRNELLLSAFKKTPEQVVTPYLENLFKKEIKGGKFLVRHKGLNAFTAQQLQPVYRSILDDMNRASINLIKLEREQGSIELSTLRFNKWLVSIPFNSEKLPDFYDLPAVKAITKPITDQLSYEHSRRAIDQGHKMIANINMATALQGNAIAAIWNAHKKTDTYDARPEHWERNEKLYVMRDSWAVKDGLVKKTNGMWLEDIPDPPSVPINCTCFWSFEYSFAYLASMFPEAITQKGRDLIASAK